MSSSANLTKLYFRIGEVSNIVGVEPHVLRYWEREFRSIRPQKSAKGQRVYTRSHVETLLKVKELLYSHRFTIEGARKRLRQGGLEPASEQQEEQQAASKEALEALRGELLSIREEIVLAMTRLSELE